MPALEGGRGGAGCDAGFHGRYLAGQAPHEHYHPQWWLPLPQLHFLQLLLHGAPVFMLRQYKLLQVLCALVCCHVDVCRHLYLVHRPASVCLHVV